MTGRAGRGGARSGAVEGGRPLPLACGFGGGWAEGKASGPAAAQGRASALGLAVGCGARGRGADGRGADGWRHPRAGPRSRGRGWAGEVGPEALAVGGKRLQAAVGAGFAPCRRPAPGGGAGPPRPLPRAYAGATPPAGPHFARTVAPASRRARRGCKADAAQARTKRGRAGCAPAGAVRVRPRPPLPAFGPHLAGPKPGSGRAASGGPPEGASGGAPAGGGQRQTGPSRDRSVPRQCGLPEHPRSRGACQRSAAVSRQAPGCGVCGRAGAGAAGTAPCDRAGARPARGGRRGVAAPPVAVIA
jgi:hypothetical protein